jgi:hypothetical protein
MTEDLERLAARQRGLFTRAQARACGYSDYRVRRRIRTGEWQVVLGPVLAPRAVATRRLIDLAAALALPQGVLAGPPYGGWSTIGHDVRRGCTCDTGAAG